MSDQPARLVATSSQTVGPFFHFGLTTDARMGVMVGPDTPGERLRLRVRVTDGQDAPVPDCLVELWQADAAGTCLGGRLPTDLDGACVFDTVRPGRLDDGRGGRQASHINVRLFMRGLLRAIHARAYFSGDPALGEDAVLALVPESRRATLLAVPLAALPGTWTFDVRLQGEKETVFFDL